MSTHHAIEVYGLRKVYPGEVEAVAGIDFTVAEGEVFGLLGPNGAGKSTTIGMLTATVAPTSGTARIGGFDVTTEPLAARCASSVLFQDPVIDRPLTGRRNLEIHAQLWGVPGKVSTRRIDDIVEAFDLLDLIERPAGSYSGGERRRLEIARALVSAPRVVFLDEPTVGLDPRIRHELLDVIDRLRERSAMTILLTTHYLDEAERLSDRIAIMRGGRIVALGTAQELMSSLGRELVELRVPGNAAAALASLRVAGVASGDAFTVGSTVIIPTPDRAAPVLASIAELDIPTVAAVNRRPTLDDVYLALTGDPIDVAA